MEKQILIPNELKAKITTDMTALLSGSKIERIDTTDQMNAANIMLQSVKAQIVFAEGKKEELYRPYKDAADGVTEWFSKPLATLRGIEANAKAKIREFQERAKLEQERLQRIADEEKRKAQEKLFREAEEKRRKEEAARQEEEKLRQEAANAKNKDERERLEKEAARKRAEADKAAEAAQAKETLSQNIVAPIVPPAPTAKGFSTYYKYSVEVNNPELFIKTAISKGDLHLLLPNQETLDKLAKALEVQFNYQGCRLVKTAVDSSRKR